MRSILATIFREHPDADLTKAEIVQLTQASRRLPTDWVEGVRDRAIAREIGQILRSEKFTDEHGAELRVYHCYKQFVQVDGKEVQQTFWRDIHSMNRRQMIACLRSRYALAKDIQVQADATRQYWNREVASKLQEKQIQKRLFE